MLSILPPTTGLALALFSRSLGFSSLTTLRMVTTLRIPPSRRPADVWFPRGPSGGQEAWDFSVTSALRLGPAPPDPAAFSGVFSSVESRKKAFLLRRASLFASWSSRQLVAVGLTPFGRLFLGSTVRVIVVHPSAVLMPVSRSRSSSRAPFTGQTRARSRTNRVAGRLIDSPLHRFLALVSFGRGCFHLFGDLSRWHSYIFFKHLWVLIFQPHQSLRFFFP